jgi:putative glutamine amidotransferase
VAQAADGVIEAVEMTDHPWLIAVQWHPEITAVDDLAQQQLFDAFVKAAASKKK